MGLAVPDLASDSGNARMGEPCAKKKAGMLWGVEGSASRDLRHSVCACEMETDMVE